MPALIFFAIVFCSVFIKFAPFGTAVIIDRRTHYCKTKPRGGFYFFNPLTDEVTTMISTIPYTKQYSEIFETYDSNFVRLTFSVTYHAESVESVLAHLKADKRSIDDLIKCAVDSTISSFDLNNVRLNLQNISEEIKNRMALSVSPFGFIIDNYISLNLSPINNTLGKGKKFKPHVCKSDGPISYN